jgi:plastocyanin
MPNQTDTFTPRTHPAPRGSLRARRFVSFAALAAVPLMAVACGSSGGSTASKAPATTPKTAAVANQIQMKLIAYRPMNLTIKVGETVTWKQNDPGFHTATSGTVDQNAGGVTPKPDGKFDSGQLATGKTFSHKFTEPGTYPFYCEIHPATMHGTITVK